METKDKKIVSLTKNHISLGETPDDVKQFLYLLVEKAERGELQGLAIAWVEGLNNVHIKISEGCAGSYCLVAGVSGLNYEINRLWARHD